MRSKNKIGRAEIIVLFTSLGCLLVAFAFQANINYQKSVFQRRAADLAKNLEVDIQKYNPDEFPIDYFQVALTQGMPISKVHQIVRGYKLSLVCPHTNSEVFYFYSVDDRGIEIELLYDLTENAFINMKRNDNNSVMINTNG